MEQDKDSLFEIMQRLLDNAESISGFTKSSLYSHMALKQPNEQPYDDVRQSLRGCLKEEQCAFIQGDSRFAALLEK